MNDWRSRAKKDVADIISNSDPAECTEYSEYLYSIAETIDVRAEAEAFDELRRNRDANN